jgi:hypothetical protein
MPAAMNALSKIAFGFFLLAASAESVRAEVVFGNLGPTGAGGLSSTQTDIGPGSATTTALAQGFTTGGASSNLQLESVTIGAFATSTGTLPRTISIYSNVANFPGSSLFTSAATQVGSNAKYTFNFTGAALSANTSYWVVPDFSVSLTWVNEAEDFTTPTQQNSSGYAYLGTARIQNNNPGVWASVPGLAGLSVSVVAVPEPSSIGLAIAGICAGGVALARRRKSIAG